MFCESGLYTKNHPGNQDGFLKNRKDRNRLQTRKNMGFKVPGLPEVV
jgi:hypothetical protein